jgi:hypothetical protein
MIVSAMAFFMNLFMKEMFTNMNIEQGAVSTKL